MKCLALAEVEELCSMFYFVYIVIFRACSTALDVTFNEYITRHFKVLGV